jgi:hypothetical protein
MAIFNATRADADRAAQAAEREAGDDNAFEQWRDQFLLAFGACGFGDLASQYDEGEPLALLLVEYHMNGWPPVEAMFNEIANDGERRLISDGPET